MKVGGDQRVQELTQGKIYIRARGMDGTLLHKVYLYQHSLRDECRCRVTHLVRLCRLRLQVYGGLWFTVHTHRNWTNIGSWMDMGPAHTPDQTQLALALGLWWALAFCPYQA